MFFKRKKLTEKQKAHLNRYLHLEIGFVVGILFIITILITNAPFSMFSFLSNSFSTALYDGVVVSNLDDNVTTRISNNCGVFPDLIDQIDCVMAEINFIYNYTSSHSEGMLVNTPDEYEQKGGVCRDIVILQKSIFMKMDWDADYRYPKPNHVTLSILKKGICSTHPVLGNSYCWVYCDIDGKDYNCN